jgi:2-polyprenyl-3-methyl-5-hydroxy-6-metoxy-1,4-benzoquinol methylase
LTRKSVLSILYKPNILVGILLFTKETFMKKDKQTPDFGNWVPRKMLYMQGFMVIAFMLLAVFISNWDGKGSVLDIGCGSGALSRVCP